MLYKIKYIAFLFIVLPCFSQFGSQQIITLEADGPQVVVAADIDGDGRLDVVTASRFGNHIAWVRSTNGQGAFGTLQLIGILEEATWVHVADLDGDGDMDVIGVSPFTQTVVWYKNLDGNGTFGPEQVIVANAINVNSAVAADLDGDGDLDIVTAIDLESKVAWHENLNGLGSFGPQQIISSTNANCRSVIALDMDGDGDLDIVANSSGSINLTWFENLDGQGSFGPKIIINTNPTPIYFNQIVGFDLDGDGDMDILGANPGSDRISWFENLDGLGNFSPEKIISTETDFARSVYAADIDNDGDLDVLSASAIDGKIAWYENLDGLGSFGPQQVISNEHLGARFVFAADMDQDGVVDVLACSQNDDKVVWYKNNILGIPDNDLNRVILYPNPVKNDLHIKNSNAPFMQITVLDVLGNPLMHLPKNPLKINLSSLKRGVYFVILTDEKNRNIKKIIKE